MEQHEQMYVLHQVSAVVHQSPNVLQTVKDHCAGRFSSKSLNLQENFAPIIISTEFKKFPNLKHYPLHIPKSTTK